MKRVDYEKAHKMSSKQLFSDFETTSEAQWKEKIIADLKGKDYDSTLLWVDDDGITHHPFYHSESIKNTELVKAIQAAQKANKEWFYVQPETLQTGYSNKYIDLLKEGKSISFNDIASELKSAFTNGQKIIIDGNFFRQAGATILQELSYTLQATVDYFDAGTENGIPPQEIATLIEFKLGFGTSYCAEIAKARAFRYLVQQIYKAYKVEHDPIVFGEASNYYHSHKDPHTNLLRLSTQAMSIVLGNCDSIVLAAYDAIETPSSLGTRMSENIPRILKEESFFEEVQDVAKGSFYLEHLSAQITEKTWQQFLAIEAKGGLHNYANSGALKIALAESHALKLEAYQQNKKTLLGVNKFVNEASNDLRVKETKNAGIPTYVLSNEIAQ